MAFHLEKKQKLWIRIAVDRYTQEVLGVSIGSRDGKAFKALMAQIWKHPVGHYGTDDWKVYKTLPQNNHLAGKKHTTQIESLNANVRHYLARFRRRTRCYSKCPIMVELSLFFLISEEVMSHPVVIPGGQTLDRSTVDNIITHQGGRHPYGGDAMPMLTRENCHMILNLKNEIEEWLQENPDYLESTDV